VAEALCHQCRPYLKAAFRAKGDWCARHAAPDSQCHACHPELKDKIQPGGGHALANHRSGAPAAPLCEHQIDKSKCPFCTPSLIQTDGFCAGHNVAEALCVKCRPYLEKAFKAKNDWCADHGLPMSQCLAHNSKPDTKPKADG
jgi:cobalt-zinc-cadmium efflux system membrane fusion protein